MKKNSNTPTLVNSKDVGVSDRFDDVYMDYIPNEICSAEKDGNSILFKSQNNIHLQVEIYTPTMIRFRYAHKGNFQEDFSYAINPDFEKIDTPVQFEEKDDYFHISTNKLNCSVQKSNLGVSISDKDGNILCADKSGYSARQTIHKGVIKVAIQKESPSNEMYFGLGDKSSALNLRGQNCDNYNTDAFAYGEGSYTLYRSIPFYYGLNEGKAYGIFMDNSYRSHFEFDINKDNTTTFWAEGGEMNYYFIYGPELMSISQQYHELTGTTALPSMWSLGFHQCRWSYYPDARVRQLAEDFRKHQIPCDAIYLDIDYMDGYRCFTVNEKIFPDLKGLVADIKKDGFSTIVMIDPGIMEDPNYWVYQSGIENDVFCRRSDGTLMTGPVWPESCVFPDFTKPEARSWWEKLYEELYGNDNIDGFWNDMNEPAVFKVNNKTFPDDVLHHYDGHPTNHRKAHNIYGMQMSKATKDGLLNIKPAERPFVLTRATFSGGQRYAAVWTGDNVATWKHLIIANRQSQRLSISGFSLVGSDVGGFVDQPTGELMARWIQMAVFHPLFRIHSMGNNADGSGAVLDNIMELDAADRKDQEPWSYGEKYTDINREAINLRYKLLAYLYTAFYEQETLGLPVLRSMAFYDQTDEKVVNNEREFMFGNDILVSPVVRPGAKTQTIYLPKGEWFDYWTNKLLIGQKYTRKAISETHIPFFVKAGSVLPLYPVRQHTKEAVEYLELNVYTGTGESTLYEDSGNGFEYQNGAYQKIIFKSELSEKEFIVSTIKEGNFKPDYDTVKVNIIVAKNKYKTLTIDGQTVDFQVNDNVLSFETNAMFNELKLS